MLPFYWLMSYIIFMMVGVCVISSFLFSFILLQGKGGSNHHHDDDLDNLSQKSWL